MSTRKSRPELARTSGVGQRSAYADKSLETLGLALNKEVLRKPLALKTPV